jgi:hypothetical protein
MKEKKVKGTEVRNRIGDGRLFRKLEWVRTSLNLIRVFGGEALVREGQARSERATCWDPLARFFAFGAFRWCFCSCWAAAAAAAAQQGLQGAVVGCG